MDGKSSRNQEIHPIADFKDRAIPLGATRPDHAKPAASQSVNQVIHPIANFHDMAQSFDEKGTDAAQPNERVEIVIDSDIAPFFPTAESVNEALRALVQIARRNGKPNAAK
jgi:hypothetical protein